MPPETLELADPSTLHVAAGICATCGTHVFHDAAGCPNDPIGDDVQPHVIRWFAAPEPGVILPVDDLETALPYLRAPFTAEAIRFKVQGAYGDKGCFVVGHIDARLVTERLNHVAGAFWHDQYEGTPDSLMGCHLTVFGTTRYDVGEGKGKALRSDAFKRAAVKFGVGVSVYAIPRADLWWRDFGKDEGGKGFISRFQKDNKWHYRLEAAGEDALRKRYQKWLDSPAGQHFGEAIDHGDVADSAGETPGGQDEPTGSDLPAVQMPVIDEKADALRTIARTLYSEIKNQPKGKTRKPAAAFNSELVAASTSHEQLQKYVASLEALKAELS